MASSLFGIVLIPLTISIKEQPNAVWFTKIWDSKEDHDASLKMDAVRALIAQAIPLVDGKPEKGQELEILGGIGFK